MSLNFYLVLLARLTFHYEKLSGSGSIFFRRAKKPSKLPARNASPFEAGGFVRAGSNAPTPLGRKWEWRSERDKKVHVEN